MSENVLAASPGNGFVAVADDTRLGFCLYRSMAQPGLDRDSIDRLLEDSRERNRTRGLTGCLHFENGTFFQWIEGPWRRIFHLIDALREDDRHMDMTILDQGTLARRLFPDWQMRFSDTEAASMFDWLAAWDKRLDSEDAYAARIRDFLQSIDR